MSSFWFIFALIAFHLGRIYWGKTQYEKGDREADELFEKNRKSELKKLFTEREVRIDKTEFDEVKFWNLVREVNKKSNNNYKNFNGLFFDKITSLEVADIIQLDNLIYRLFSERYSYDLLYASYIIFKKGDLDGVNLLMNVFLSRGEVFFKNACINSNLCLKKDITYNEDERIMFDLINEAYVIKTNKLIPTQIVKDIVLKGEPVEEKEIPIKYSELWNEYF